MRSEHWNMIKTLIIEDELPAQQLLVSICTEYCPNVSIVGITDNINEALHMINNLSPDLLLMDVQLSDKIAFDLLDRLSDKSCKIIIISAYENYALRAFKYEVVDYILKPYAPKDIIKAIEKIRALDFNQNMLDQISQIFKRKEKYSIERIKVKTASGIILLKLNDIIRIEAEGSYAVIYTTEGKKITASKPLKEYEDKLKQANFYRVHTSHLLNFDHITQINVVDGHTAIMTNGDKIPVSRRLKHDFLNAILNDAN